MAKTKWRPSIQNPDTSCVQKMTILNPDCQVFRMFTVYNVTKSDQKLTLIPLCHTKMCILLTPLHIVSQRWSEWRHSGIFPEFQMVTELRENTYKWVPIEVTFNSLFETWAYGRKGMLPHVQLLANWGFDCFRKILGSQHGLVGSTLACRSVFQIAART
jgi:hypothetical protein